MRASTALPNTREALLGPAAQRLELGLLAARTAAVMRRILDGEVLDDSDRAIFSEAKAMLLAAAEAVEFVASGGQLKRHPSSFGFGAVAFAVETTSAAVPPADLPQHLRAMADDLLRIETEPHAENTRRLLQIFATLADVATRQAGTVGEGGRSLI